ncbi:translesion DNA synthesis-associated protein ImuA [Alteromonas facilis]|uniref:translesion DNA synthesis-associated protein ImuA n=1 Tax=Alteromonas facilis TaxID=2048004 RepID=UPI0013D9FB9C|nr:translesion DNA synthesis-associated protein ImuA [Alteromonas facilis]
MSALITHLKNKQLLWQASQNSQSNVSKLSTGIASLDEALNGGFPDHGVVRINSVMSVGELRLCMPVIQARQADLRQLFFLSPPAEVNAEMLAEYDINLDSAFFIAPNETSDTLWACEQCLKSGVCHTAILWCNTLSLSQAKRLQVAAEQSHSLLIVFQYTAQVQPLPISLSMRITRSQQLLHIDIDKQRGGWPVSGLQIAHTLNGIKQRYLHERTTGMNNVVHLHAQQ